MPKPNNKRNKTPKVNSVVTKEATIHLHKRLHKCSFKRRAPTAIKEVREFATKIMGTSDVRVDVRLNQFLWSQGIRNVPFRVRVRLARKKNEDEDAKEKMYTLVTYVPTADFHGLVTENVGE
eukprot:TRINITY_DN8424_c0_g1_i1.p1 TRINITY_DN8424_c0_g1~~TRINITY_DN8424_c0_g1_i1.p1  ORF type:complete len:122 (-),score=23.44 TRINITY_DN8424_c0_g1_i1:121-486(-)